jgi:hypothetical protein
MVGLFKSIYIFVSYQTDPMIKKTLFLILFFGGLSERLYAQDSIIHHDTVLPFYRMEMPDRKTNIIKTNPMALVFGCIPFYTAEARLVNETAVSLYQTVYFGASYLFKGPLLLLSEQDTAYNPDKISLKVRGWRVQAGYKFYINGWIESKRKKLRGLAPKGFYVSPHISYATAKVFTNYSKSVGVYYKINFFDVDLVSGYQLVAGRFALDAFTGLGYMNNELVYYEKSSSYKVRSSNDDYLFSSNLKFILGFNIGMAF